MIKNFLIGLFALLLLVTVQIPFIYSIECSQISPANYNTCIQIKNMNLTDLEKDMIISNLDYQDKFFPNHKYIFDRNTNLIITDAPQGVSKQQGTFVKDVWNSIFAVMPSVLYNNSILAPSSSQVLTGFNLRYTLPSNYYNSGYPNTNNGDCQRIYSLTKNISENKVYVNDIYQGSGKLVNVSVSKDSVIKSVFNVQVSHSIDHYTWKRYCAYYEHGYCARYRYRCQYSSNEVQGDNIQVTNLINVKYYTNSLFANLTTLSSYSENTKFNLNFSNSVKVNFQDSSYAFNKFSYTINYSKAPYYILTLRADNYSQEQIKNLFLQKNNLIVKNTNNCFIEAFDFFYYSNKTCYAEQKPINLTISTDKLRYFPNEIINVSIYPQNLSVNISYGNQTKIVVGNTVLSAKFLENRIIAVNGSSEAERIIYVQEQNRFVVIYYFIIFLAINYILYKILEKCFGGAI